MPGVFKVTNLITCWWGQVIRLAEIQPWKKASPFCKNLSNSRLQSHSPTLACFFIYLLHFLVPQLCPGPKGAEQRFVHLLGGAQTSTLQPDHLLLITLINSLHLWTCLCTQSLPDCLSGNHAYLCYSCKLVDSLRQLLCLPACLGEVWTIYQNRLPILVELVHFSLLQAPLAGSPSQLTCLLRCSLLLRKNKVVASPSGFLPQLFNASFPLAPTRLKLTQLYSFFRVFH